MPAFRSVVSVLLRALGDFSLHPQGRPCGRPPAAAVLAPAATRRSPWSRLTVKPGQAETAAGGWRVVPPAAGSCTHSGLGGLDALGCAQFSAPPRRSPGTQGEPGGLPQRLQTGCPSLRPCHLLPARPTASSLPQWRRGRASRSAGLSRVALVGRLGHTWGMLQRTTAVNLGQPRILRPVGSPARTPLTSTRPGTIPSMACKGSGVQIPSAPPGTRHLLAPL
jgi:hypothetical protein